MPFKRPRFLFIIIFLFIYLNNTALFAEYVWKSDLPLPAYDPLWEKVGEMWKDHWDGKNIDDIILILHKLENKYPDKVDPYLWLGKCYYIKGIFVSKKRQKYNKKAEEYAVKAHQMDKDNFFALFILLHSLNHCEDINYIIENYGDWIKSMAPLPTGRLLPDMDYISGWDDANYYWKKKENFKYLVLAVENFETIAKKNPDDWLAQLWACFAYYNLGEHYSLTGDHDGNGLLNYNKAIFFCDKAIKINPNRYQVHFWYQISLSRKIQNASLFKKARYLKPIMSHLLFCVQENALYNSCGPVYILATMIDQGGWVCEKGMALAGYNTNMVITLLYVAEILYPDVLYIPYINAVLLEREDRDKEALKILGRHLEKGPPSDNDPERNIKMFNYKNLKAFQDRLLAKKENRKIF